MQSTNLSSRGIIALTRIDGLIVPLLGSEWNRVVLYVFERFYLSNWRLRSSWVIMSIKSSARLSMRHEVSEKFYANCMDETNLIHSAMWCEDESCVLRIRIEHTLISHYQLLNETNRAYQVNGMWLNKYCVLLIASTTIKLYIYISELIAFSDSINRF